MLTEEDLLPLSVTEIHEYADSDPKCSIPLSKMRKIITNQKK